MADARGNSPMHMAARHGHADAVQLLIDIGCKVRETHSTLGVFLMACAER